MSEANTPRTGGELRNEGSRLRGNDVVDGEEGRRRYMMMQSPPAALTLLQMVLASWRELAGTRTR